MKSRLHGGTENCLYDFSVNLNPVIKESYIKKMLSSLSYAAIKYPEQRGNSLVNLIASKNNIPSDNIVLGNGSIELFYYLPEILKPQRAFTLEPTFCEYSYICDIYNINLKRFLPESEFYWDFSKIQKELKPEDLLFICNPNNPTGTLFYKEDILALLDTGAYIVIDEAFMDFCPENQSLLKDVESFENLIVVKSLTKIYSIAGLRIGFLAANRQISERLKEILPLWNVNGVALEMAKIMIDSDIIEKTRKIIVKEKEFLFKKLKKYLKPFDSNANFLLCKSEKTMQLHEFAKSRGFCLRDNSGFYGLDESYFRIAIKERKENMQLVELFMNFFEGVCCD